MSWITVVWSMNAAACLTLAGISLRGLVQTAGELGPFGVFGQRSCSGGHRRIRVSDDALRDSRAIRSTRALDTCARWVLIISFVSFVRLYLQAGRSWLAWTICGLRTLVLILNFIFTPNLNFRQITRLRQFSWGGEIISVPIGVANPWGLLSSVSLALAAYLFC